MHKVSENIRVMHVIPTLKKGGAERLVINIVNELINIKTVNCLIVALNEGNDYYELSKNLPVEICHSKVFLSVSKKHKADISHLEKIIQDFKPHIIHSHLFEAEILTRFKTHPEIAYISHMHANEKHLQNFNWLKLYNKKILTNYYEKLYILKKYKACNNHFIAISKHTDKYLRKVLPNIFHNNIHYLPNAIDYKTFYNKKTIDYSPQKPKFVTIGRLVKSKNQSFLVDVIEELLKRNVDAHLDILGQGEMKNSIQDKINQKKLQKNILLQGIVENVSEYLNKASLYIHGATYEPYGLVLLEAMASGLPVIALNGGGNTELLENGKNGFLIETPNPKIFADKIMEILQNKELYSSISHYAQQYAQNYNIENYSQKLAVLYNKILLK